MLSLDKGNHHKSITVLFSINDTFQPVATTASGLCGPRFDSTRAGFEMSVFIAREILNAINFKTLITKR